MSSGLSFRLVRFAFALVLASATVAKALTLSGVTVDRSTAILSGTGFLSSTGTGVSVAGFGPTVIDPVGGGSYLPSIALNSDASGTVDFSNPLAFPPVSFLSGSTMDYASSAGLLTVLFQKTGAADLFVIDLAGPSISGTGLGLTFPAIVDLRVFSATSASVVPLPASMLLLTSALCLGGVAFGRRRVGPKPVVTAS